MKKKTKRTTKRKTTRSTRRTPKKVVPPPSVLAVVVHELLGRIPISAVNRNQIVVHLGEEKKIVITQITPDIIIMQTDRRMYRIDKPTPKKVLRMIAYIRNTEPMSWILPYSEDDGSSIWPGLK